MSASPGLASLVIRTLNEERGLADVLAALERQSHANFEVLVVDSGSTDRTLEIAEEHSASVYRLQPEDFSYGHALNYGYERARGEFLVALSGHAVPWFDGWLARLLGHLDNPEVAASTGGGFLPGQDYAARRHRVVRIDARNYLQQPTWGLNNAAAAIRAELWRQHPFDERLVWCEDLEWGWYWMKRGYALIWDEACSVIHEHHDSLRQQYSRAWRLGSGLAATLPEQTRSTRALAGEWLLDPLKAAVLALIRGYSPTRAAHLWGKYRGLRAPSEATYPLEPPAAAPREQRLRTAASNSSRHAVGTPGEAQ